MSPKVSVIIPCRNEAGGLPETLESIHMEENQCEALVVVPSADDDSIPTALRLGARVVIAGRAHRAVQMNRGAEEAKGGVLLFLHADTRLNPGSIRQVTEVMQRPGVVGGAFSRRFDSGSFFLKFTCLLADWRGNLTGWCFGDQAIFSSAAVHRQLGGYREIQPFEDLDYSRRLKRHGKVCTLRPAILGSARRFYREGPVIRTLKDLRLTAAYFWGAVENGGKPPSRPAKPEAVAQE